MRDATLYQHKSDQVWAVKITADNLDIAARWCGGRVATGLHGGPLLVVPGDRSVPYGGWLVRTMAGDWTTFHTDAFLDIYEPVPEPQPSDAPHVSADLADVVERLGKDPRALIDQTVTLCLDAGLPAASAANAAALVLDMAGYEIKPRDVDANR